MKCSNCGREMPDGYAFCIICGEKLIPSQGEGRLSALSAPDDEDLTYTSVRDGGASDLLRAPGDDELGGAQIGEGSGAPRRPEAPQAAQRGAQNAQPGAPRRKFCINCGTPFEGEGTLCAGCSAARRAAQSPVWTPAPPPALTPVGTHAQVAEGGGRTKKLLYALAAGAALLLIILLVVFMLRGAGRRPSADPVPVASSAPRTELTPIPASTPLPTAPPVSGTADAVTPIPAPSAAPTPVPTPTPTPLPTPMPTPVRYGPGPADISGHDSRLVEPDSYSWLSDYTTRYVLASGGVSIYLRWGPSADYESFDTVWDGEGLTLLASQNGFYLAKTQNGRIGWVNGAMTASNNSVYNSLPSLSETYWTYEKGAGAENSYACKFHTSPRSAEGYNLWDGAYISGDWTLDRRRLTFDGIWFIWNGYYFISKDQFDSPSGKINYFIRPDQGRVFNELEAAGYCAQNNYLPDGSYYVELAGYALGDPTTLLFYEDVLLGYHENDSPLLESTGVLSELPLAPGCSVVDTSQFDAMGITIFDYTDLPTLWSRYGDGTILYIDINDGEITSIEKIYLP